MNVVKDVQKIIITGNPLEGVMDAPDLSAGTVDAEEPCDEPFRKTAPAGKLVDPDKLADRVKETVARGSNYNLEMASSCLLLAAIHICEDSEKSFQYYLSHPSAEEAEYLALDGKRATDQIQRILSVMAELAHLDD